MDDCAHCSEHAERSAAIDVQRKKIEQNCHQLEIVKKRISALERLETHFEYMKKGMDQMQANHKESLKQMERANDKALQAVVNKVAQMEWIVRGVFLIILAAFVKFMVGGGV